MVGVSTPQMAAAVSNAGALGSIGIGASTVAQAQEMIAQTRSLTDQPFNVNVFCHRTAVADEVREAAWLNYLKPYFEEFGASPPARINEPYKSFLDDPEMLKMLLSQRPTAVSFHFGLPPSDWIKSMQDAGIFTIASATSAAEAQLIEDAGIEAVIAQGLEAGGHRGVFIPERENENERLETFALVKELVAACKIPVIAAGGIMNGKAIADALQLGAAAAQLGTAFILCPESAANQAYRTNLKSVRSKSTAITSVISGRPARGLVNRMYTDIDQNKMENEIGHNKPPLPDYPIAYDAGKALAAAAAARDNHDFAVQWAGTNAVLARELPAAELIAILVQELLKCAESQNRS